MPQPKGHKPPKAGMGRPKGATNRFTRDVKELIFRSLESVGGEKYLIQLALENPASYATLLGKVLPTTLSGDPHAPLSLGVIMVPAKGE